MRTQHLGIILLAVLGMTIDCRPEQTPVEVDTGRPRHRPGPPPPEYVPPEVPTFVRVTAGSFLMGSPVNEPNRADNEAQHTVTLTRDFLLQAHEVTQREWTAAFDNNPSRNQGGGEYCPVDSVSWWDALSYANFRSSGEGLDECYRLSGCTGEPGNGLDCSGATFVGLDCTGYRLPTEAEWEYAARAGTDAHVYGPIDDIAWHEQNSYRFTHPVGQKTANAWGLHDMLGNVWEWTWDAFEPYSPSDVVDPTGSDDRGGTHVLRGGSWNYQGDRVRVAYRNELEPGITGRNGSLGLRLARTAPPQ